MQEKIKMNLDNVVGLELKEKELTRKFIVGNKGLIWELGDSVYGMYIYTNFVTPNCGTKLMTVPMSRLKESLEAIEASPDELTQECLLTESFFYFLDYFYNRSLDGI